MVVYFIMYCYNNQYSTVSGNLSDNPNISNFYAETGEKVVCITLSIEDNSFTDAQYNDLEPSWIETEKSFKEIYTNQGYENMNITNRTNIEIAGYHGCSIKFS